MGNGAILENTQIAVDFWRARKYPWIKHFFLSHVHADHTEGLTPSWRHAIYCSDVSRKLLIHKIGIDESLIEAIEVGVPKAFSSKNGGFVVTLFDANHCPGSVMFLFEGEFGRILYTADFRCDAKFLEWFLPLSIGHVDMLYLDNTYLREGADFPTREQATEEVLEVISEHPTHRILIICYSLGKEELLVKIARKFNEWIIVSAEKYKLLGILEMPNVFTTNEREGRIRAIVTNDLKNKSLQAWIRDVPTIAIFPTCMFNKDNNPHRIAMYDKYFFIPYSDHSSFKELTDFLGYLNPGRVVPITKENAFKCLKVAREIRERNGSVREIIGNGMSFIDNDVGTMVKIDDLRAGCETMDGSCFVKDFVNKNSKTRKTAKARTRRPLVRRSASRKGVVFESENEAHISRVEKLANEKLEQTTALDFGGSHGKVAETFVDIKEADEMEELVDNPMVDNASTVCENVNDAYESPKNIIVLSDSETDDKNEDGSSNDLLENSMDCPGLDEMIGYIKEESIFALQELYLAGASLKAKDKAIDHHLRILSNACSYSLARMDTT